MQDVLKIGMPSGSLADPNRGGNLIKLLEVAGFYVSGYANGGPSKFNSMSYLLGWDGRPQEFGTQLDLGEMDVAIAGNDWIRERLLELELEYGRKVELEKVMPLNRGGVRLVGIVNPCEHDTTEEYLRALCAEKKLITVVSEMPYMALDWMQRKLRELGLFDQYSDFSVQKYKTPSKIESGVLIYETWGKTEAKIKNGGADIGLEITQSGSAIRNYGLKIIETVYESQTSIWINPAVRQNKAKCELLDMFLLNMCGALNAENKVMIAFNVPNDCVEAMDAYLAEKRLFADESTVTIGKHFTVYSIQVDSNDTELPLARIRYEIAKLGGKNINTMPIDSSISKLSVI